MVELPGSSGGNEFACSAWDDSSVPESGRSFAEGNGYPLQFSCLESSMDWGARQATVHGVATSWTQLSNTHTVSGKNVFAKSWIQLSNAHTWMFPWADTFSPGGVQNVGHVHKMEICGCKELDTIEQHTHTNVPLSRHLQPWWVAKCWTHAQSGNMWLQRVGHDWATHTHTCSPVRWTLSDTHTYGPGHFQTHTHVPLWGGHLQTDRQKHACARIWTTDFVSPDEVHRCSVRRWCDWPPSSGLLSSLCMQVGLPLRKRADRILHTNWEFQLPCLINSLFFFNSNKRLMFQI